MGALISILGLVGLSPTFLETFVAAADGARLLEDAID